MTMAMLYGILSGVLGTGMGGILGVAMRGKDSLKARLLGFSAGFMLAVVAFDLLPEALSFAGATIAIASTVLGATVVALLRDWVEKRVKKKTEREGARADFLRAGILISIAIAIHNFPEGLAIGSGEAVGSGLAMTLLIAMHDVPEGAAMALTLKVGGVSAGRAVLTCALTGIPTVAGAVVGFLIGGVSPIGLSVCFGLAAGAMLDVLFCELLPKAFETEKTQAPLGVLFGLLLGFALLQIL